MITENILSRKTASITEFKEPDGRHERVAR